MNFLRTEEQGRKETQKGRNKTKNNQTRSMNESDSLSLVQGSLTVTCMIVSNLSITTHQLTSSAHYSG
jgi:hypothetical protein